MKYIILACFIMLGCIEDMPNVCEQNKGLHSWGANWSRDNTDIKLENRTNNSAWSAILKSSVNDWNHLDTGIGFSEVGRNGEVIVIETEGEEWLGLTELYVNDEGFVYRSRISLDRRLLGYSDIAIKHVICMELGHAMGLGHVQQEPSCMDDCQWTDSPEGKLECMNDPEKSTPSEHDAEQLVLAYGYSQERCEDF
jgi:hypothetical protein